jgi:hypothetical protein
MIVWSAIAFSLSPEIMVALFEGPPVPDVQRQTFSGRCKE